MREISQNRCQRAPVRQERTTKRGICSLDAGNPGISGDAPLGA